jgi:hypothetical protein
MVFKQGRDRERLIGKNMLYIFQMGNNNKIQKLGYIFIEVIVNALSTYYKYS